MAFNETHYLIRPPWCRSSLAGRSSILDSILASREPEVTLTPAGEVAGFSPVWVS